MFKGIAKWGHYNRYGNGANILFGFHTIRTQLRQIFQPNVPCKVCDVAPVSSSITMIPAKMTCSSGWSLEYAGVLTAACQYSSLAIREYLCIDENAECWIQYLMDSTQQNYDYRIIHSVQKACVTLPCRPNKKSQLI